MCDATTASYDNDGCTFTSVREDEDLSLPREKPRFDRVMKMRNTDGRPVRYSTWKPVRMYDGRGNIGVRNFKKLERG
jgi:hypothetical protein